MTWKRYAFSLLLTNAVLVGISYLILRLQNLLPLNPNGMGSMEPT
jgi:K+-transporting ATPase ATPase A chain